MSFETLLALGILVVLMAGALFLTAWIFSRGGGESRSTFRRYLAFESEENRRLALLLLAIGTAGALIGLVGTLAT